MVEERRFDWFSAVQFVASLMGVLLFGGLSLGGILITAIANLEGMVPVPVGQTTSLILLFSGMGFVGLLLLPSAWYAGKRLFNGERERVQTWRGAGWLITILPVLLALGYLAEWNTAGGRILLATIHVLANGTAIFWVLHVGRRDLAEESPQRFWGVFGSGLALAPMLALLLEFLFLIFIGLLWYLYLSQQPALREQISNLVERLPQSAASPAILDRIASKYLFNPGVLATVFSYVAVIIPLVEEIIKPVGVWLLARRKLSPQDGFVLGMLSGAGYALFENLTLSANAEVWVVVMITRIGTTAVHMLTSGLVGWGLASVWTGEKGGVSRLAKAFLTSVLLHGVWNALNILSALAQFSGAQGAFSPLMFWIAQFAPLGIFLLAVGSFYGLLRSNRVLKRAIMSQVENE